LDVKNSPKKEMFVKGDHRKKAEAFLAPVFPEKSQACGEQCLADRGW